MHCDQVSLAPRLKTSPSYFVETGHRFIGTSDLDLEESGFFASAPFFGALDLRLVGIIPGSWSTEDIFSLLSRKRLPFVVLPFEYKLVRASLALEAVCRRSVTGRGLGRRNREHVRARRADCGC